MTMNEITRSEADRLIERLAVEVRKTCPVCPDYQNHCDLCREHFGDIIEVRPIMLTDVLEKMANENKYYITDPRTDRGIACNMLLSEWKECGFTKSLQDILAEAEWEDKIDNIPDIGEARAKGFLVNKVMKGPYAELFEYLLSLFPET